MGNYAILELIIVVMGIALDKSLLAVISGVVVGILVMAGVISPTHADEATQQLSLGLGALITVVTIIAWFAHHTTIEKSKIDSPYAEVKTPVVPGESPHAEHPIDNPEQTVAE